MAETQRKGLSVQSLPRKATRFMVILLYFLFAGALFLGSLLLLASPGKPAHVLDERGIPLAEGLSEKIHIRINGVEQGMFIQSKDVRNPVLLFVHGGPGMPEYWLTRRYPTGLEEDFTIAWWEQRGSGLSYSPSIPPETMNYEQFISDTLAVTDYLRSRFGKEKIYLMAHSGGSFFGIQAAARAPERYYAYIGIAQMAYQLKSENLAYAYMLEQFKTAGNTKMVRKLEAAPPTMSVPLPAAYNQLRDAAMHSLGIGTTREMKSVITGVFIPSWLSPVYTLGEKVNLWRGKAFSKKLLWNMMMATDLSQQVTELDLPVYFFHGRYDYTDSYTLAKDYFERLKAPVKGFYTFEQSAHSPLFEEPDKMRVIIREDVLAGKNTHVDGK